MTLTEASRILHPTRPDLWVFGECLSCRAPSGLPMPLTRKDLTEHLTRGHNVEITRCEKCGSEDKAVRFVIASPDDPEPRECTWGFHGWDGLPPECSMCRGRHGREVEHPCE
jgi:hypothetical protein